MSKINAKWVNLDSNSLEDNSNDIRVKIDPAGAIESTVSGLAIKSGGIGAGSIADEAITEAKLDAVDAAGDGEILSWSSGDGQFEWIPAAGADAKDVKVSANDTTAGFLNGKIVAGSAITLTELNDGSNESLRVEADINDAGTAVDELWSASKINTELAGKVNDTGGETIAGVKTFSSIPILPGSDPTSGNEATRKSYVDNLVTGLSWKEPVEEQALAPTGTEIGSDGYRVLINGTGTGTFSGQDNDIATYDATGSSWSYDSPSDNWAVFDKDTDNAYTYDSTSTSWIQFSGAGQVIAGAGLTKTVNTLDVGAGSGITVNADDVQIDLDSSLTITGTWNFTGLQVGGEAVSTENLTVETLTLDATDISNKNTTLSNTPDVATNVQVTPQGGPQQVYTDDFTVSGTTLNWSGLGMDTVVADGDKLVVSYTI